MARSKRRGERAIPAHPYRDTAVVYGVMAIAARRPRWLTGGDSSARCWSRWSSSGRDGLELVEVPRRILKGARTRRRRDAGDAARQPNERAEPGAKDDGDVDARVETLCGDLSASGRRAAPTLNALSWQVEAPLRMLLNNLDPEVAEHPEELVVYGGSGRAARSHEALKDIVRTLAPAAGATRRFSSSRGSRSACFGRTRVPRGC